MHMTAPKRSGRGWQISRRSRCRKCNADDRLWIAYPSIPRSECLGERAQEVYLFKKDSKEEEQTTHPELTSSEGEKHSKTEAIG